MRRFNVIAFGMVALNIAINVWILAEIAVYGRKRDKRKGK